MLSLLPWLLYSHTQEFDAVLDDQEYVLENPLLQDAGSFLYPLDFKTFAKSHAIWGISPDLPLNLITRPFTYLTYFANRCLSGTETPGYRIVNISIHMINGMLIFALLLSLLGRDDRRASTIALVTALGFVAHPLAVESVTYISQRFESLVTMFCMLAMLCHIKARQAGKPATHKIFASLSVFCTLLAMLSKETGVTVPALLLLLELFWLRSSVWQAFKAVRWHLVLLPLIPALIIATEWAQNGRLSVGEAMQITNGGPVQYELAHYFMTQVCAWMSYLQLILMPVGQSFDHDYPLITSALDPRFLASASIVLLMLAGSWLLHRRHGGAAGAIQFVGVLWFFITLSPSSSIIPLPDLFSEHRSYMPSVGIFITLAALLHALSASMPATLHRRIAAIGGSVCLFALCLATLLRNEVMRTREAIWQDALAKGSERPRVWKGLGIAAYNAGRHDEALRCFKRGTEVSPRDTESWINLCGLQIKLKQNEEALATSIAAIDINGTVLPLLHLRAMALVGTGRWQMGMGLWQQIIETVPTHRDSNLCLADIFFQTGQPQQAIKHLHNAEKSGPLPPAYLSMKQQMQSQLASLP